MKTQLVTIYSIIHFVIDLSCAVLVTNLVVSKTGDYSNLFTAIIIYNFFAFAMQLPIGIIADKVNKNALCAAVGCILVMMAYMLTGQEIVACTVAGMGNAMFHIGGGIDVLNVSNKKSALSGIFVSTGALGIFLGGQAIMADFWLFCIAMLLLSAITLIWLYRRTCGIILNKPVLLPRLNTTKRGAIICLILTVCIRSYVGLILAFEWKSSITLAVFSILAVVLGKMTGGIIGDKIGFSKISFVSLTVAAFCFIFAFDNPVAGIIAILFFNMTMPITLTALCNIFDNTKGMAFGILTAALFAGSLPYFFECTEWTNKIFTPAGLFCITGISAVILCIGIKRYHVFMEKNDD